MYSTLGLTNNLLDDDQLRDKNSFYNVIWLRFT